MKMIQHVLTALSRGLVFFFLFFFIPPQAHAGGVFVGNGGRAVVCFSIPATEATADGKINSRGRISIISSEPYELYLARSQGVRPGVEKLLQEKKDEVVINALHQMFYSVPEFYDELIAASGYLGPILSGIPSRDGLVLVDDFLPAVQLPPQCAYLQAVIRQQDILFYDQDIVTAMTAAARAILQLHEEVYLYGNRVAHHPTSLNTSLLIVRILTKDLDPAGLVRALYIYQFGYFITREQSGLVSPRVFNPDFYLSTYPDVKERFVDAIQARYHWVNYGVNEGRRGNLQFDLEAYKVLKDKSVSGLSNDEIVRYFIAHPEDHAAYWVFEVHPAIYDSNFYLSKYPELKNQGITTPDLAFRHWLNIGVPNGYQASAKFSARDYLSLNPDLQRALGDDYRTAIRHYGIAGMREGRKAIRE